MDQYEAKEKIKRLSAAIVNIESQALDQGRGLTNKEEGLVLEMHGAIEELTKNLPVSGPLTQPGPHDGGGYDRVGSSNGRTYKAMFNLANGSLSKGGFKDGAEFIRTIDSGRYDPRLDILATAVEGIPSSGGFAVPTEFASEWLDASLPNEVVRNLCKV